MYLGTQATAPSGTSTTYVLPNFVSATTDISSTSNHLTRWHTASPHLQLQRPAIFQPHILVIPRLFHLAFTRVSSTTTTASMTCPTDTASPAKMAVSSQDITVVGFNRMATSLLRPRRASSGKETGRRRLPTPQSTPKCAHT